MASIQQEALDLRSDVSDLIAEFGQSLSFYRKSYKTAAGAVVPDSTWTVRAVVNPMHGRESPSWRDVGLLAIDSENAQFMTLAFDANLEEGDICQSFGGARYRVTRANTQNYNDYAVALYAVMVRSQGN